jgi:hypothetical protein
MKFYFKPTLILSAILGAVLGFFTLIPLISCLSCFLYSFVAVAVIWYMKKYGFIGFISVNDGAVIGAIAGFVSFISASAIYLPIAILIQIIFKTGINMTTSALTTTFGFFTMLMLIVFMALLSALFNAFSGLVTAYVYEKIENRPNEESEPFIIE